MSLAFLAPAAHAVSPLRRALAGTSLVDVSDTGKVELRGDQAAFEAARIVRLTPRRAIVLTDDPECCVAEARAAGLRAYDLTGAFAGIRIEGEQLLRRLTQVDVSAPTAAPVAGDVSALIFPVGDGGYELYVPQELGHQLALVVLDLQAGLA